MRPRHREPLFDVGLDLRPEAQEEPSFGHGLEVVGRHGQRHRVPSEGHRDAGAHLEALGVFGGKDEGKERVVARLGRPDAVVPGRLCIRGLGHNSGRIESERSVHEHGQRYQVNVFPGMDFSVVIDGSCATTLRVTTIGG